MGLKKVAVALALTGIAAKMYSQSRRSRPEAGADEDENRAPEAAGQDDFRPEDWATTRGTQTGSGDRQEGASQRQGALGSSQGDAGAREAMPVLQPSAEVSLGATRMPREGGSATDRESERRPLSGGGGSDRER